MRTPIFNIEAYIPRLAAKIVNSFGNYGLTSLNWLTQLGVIIEIIMIFKYVNFQNRVIPRNKKKRLFFISAPLNALEGMSMT